MLHRTVVLCVATIVYPTCCVAAESDTPTSVSYLQKTSTYSADGTPQFISHSEIFIHNDRKREVNEMGQVTITDGKTGEFVTMVPKLKRFMRFGSPAEDKDNGDEKNVASGLRRPIAMPTGDDVERIGSQVIDGQRTLGLRTHLRKGPAQTTRTVWYEEQTKRPRLILLRTAAKGHQTQIDELSRFRFSPLDPALFSMEAPEGYAVLQGAVSRTAFTKSEKKASGTTGD